MNDNKIVLTIIAPVTQNNNNNNGPWFVAPRESREPTKDPPGIVLLIGKTVQTERKLNNAIELPADRREKERKKKGGISIIDTDQWSRIRRRMIGELSLTAVRETLTGVANKLTVILSLAHLLSFIFPLSSRIALSRSFSLSPFPSLFSSTSLFFLERRVHSLFLAHSVEFCGTPLDGDDNKDITATAKAAVMVYDENV